MKDEQVLAEEEDRYVQRWYLGSWPHLKVFSYLPLKTYFSLSNEANNDPDHLIKDNTGDPGFILHCYHKASKTKIGGG